MAPKNRDPKNSNLVGTNIKKMVKGGKCYYYYQMPDNSLAPLAHGDEKASIEAAHALNRALRPSGSIVERILQTPPKITTKNPLFVEAINDFEQEWIPIQNYSARSLDERRIKLNQYRREWPHKRISDLDTFVVATFLRKCTASASRQHRILLDQIFRYSASRGLSTQRPMIDIEKRRSERRKRARHTWDGYEAIYNASPQWLKNACDAALYSLQRRSDLVAINIDEQIDLKARSIRILQQKSRNYDKPVYIDIVMGEELFKAVMASVWSGITCPYLIHHRPTRITKQMRDSRPHQFAVTADYLTRAYSEVRDSVGCYDHLPKLQRPGFHSIRALGIWLYTKAGYSDEYIMAIAGHANEKMKAHYTEGHEKPAPLRVNAELSLTGVDLKNIDWETDLSKPLLKLADSAGE